MSYLTEQLARMREQIAKLTRDKVTYRNAEVTAVDVASSTFTAVVPDTEPLAGIASPPQFLPAVGDLVRLTLYGATAVYEPSSIAEGAITGRELDGAIEADIDNAVINSTVALEAANGKNAVVFSTLAPNVSGGRAGDVWWQRLGNVIIGSWEWDGDSWEVRKFGDAVFDTISAGKIVTGQLAVGVTVYVGDPLGEHSRITSSGIVHFAADDVDGVPNEVSRFGRSIGGLHPTTGRQAYMIDELGNGYMNTVSGNEVRVGGTDILDILTGYSRGVQVWYGAGALVPNIATEYGVLEVYRSLQNNRNYAGTLGICLASSENDGEAVVRVRMTDNGARPTVTSTLIAERNVTLRVGGRWNDYSFPFFFQRTANQGTDVKFLVTVSRGGGQATGTVATAGNPPFLWVADAGPYTLAAGTTLNNGSTGGSSASPPSRTTLTVTGSWKQNFTGAGAVRADTTDMVQGYNPTFGDGRAMIGFPSMTTALTNADIQSVRLYLYAYHWYYAGGTAIIGTHGQLTAPATFSGTTNRMQVEGWGRSQGRWIDLTAWAAEFKAGTARGITLGPSGGTDLEFAGRFLGPLDGSAGMTTYRPKLEIVYYK